MGLNDLVSRITAGAAAPHAALQTALGDPDTPTPDREAARQLLEQELSRAEYQQAEPAWFDMVGQSIVEFFERLLNPDTPGAVGAGGLVVIALLVVALIITAFVIWGRPRAAARSAQATASLFGEREERSARELRRAAETAARAGQFDEATVLRTRALARGLAERGILTPPPGATVHAFARQAAVAFPAHRASLDAAADAFDEVRYLRAPGTESAYALVRDLDTAIADARPEVMPELAGLSGAKT